MQSRLSTLAEGKGRKLSKKCQSKMGLFLVYTLLLKIFTIFHHYSGALNTVSKHLIFNA